MSVARRYTFCSFTDRMAGITSDCGHDALASPEPFLVTLNDSGLIAPEKVIERVRFEHPLFTRDSLAAQRRHAEVSGVDRVHFCGAYWRNGFHEDGVMSGLAVARAFAREAVPA